MFKAYFKSHKSFRKNVFEKKRAICVTDPTVLIC